jgi:hypothetical protein
MSWVAAAVAGGSIIGGVISNKGNKDAAQTAANAQISAADKSIELQRQQFEEIQQLLSPYQVAGNSALGVQSSLLGINGNRAQQRAIDQLKQSSMFGEMVKQGEEGILQNAAVTGGLRGGNTQAALAQFRPQMLSQLIQSQVQNLGGLTSIGQNAAAGVGNSGIQFAQMASNQLGQIGAAQAGSALAGGRANAQFAQNVGNMPAILYGMGLI